MAGDREMRDLLAGLTGQDWSVLTDGVDRVGQYLKREALSETDVAPIAEALSALAEHPKWDVRKAVAHALLHLRHDAFHAAIAALLEDDHALVRNAAERTISRRSEISRSGLLKDEQASMMMRWLIELESQHGPRARAAALRVAEKNTEMVMRGVYHELVKPIGALDTALENLETALGRENHPTLALAQTARGRVRFLEAIIEGLRDQMKDIEPTYSVENLRALVEDAVGLLRDRVRAKPGDLEIVVSVDPALAVEVHRYYLLQALLNILMNAYEAYEGLKRARQINVEAAVENAAHVILKISDLGAGMSDERLNSAPKFFSTSKPDGTGFGLPFTKKIVERVHHGEIRLASEKGKGTTVTIMLPLEQEQKGDGRR